MLVFQVGFRYAGGAVLDVWAPGAPTPARLAVAAARGAPPALAAALDEAAQSLRPAAHALAACHYFRLADGTVRPLAPAPAPLTFQAGDAYVGVTPGAARLAAGEPGGPGPAIARFLHLRDYFNADKLAAALLEHLLESGAGQAPEGAGVLVVEAR